MFGFTWPDENGQLTNVSWASLRKEEKALYVYDGKRWRRLWDVREATKYGSTVRVAIAAKGASDDTLQSLSTHIPSDLLTGKGVNKVERLRYLAAMPPALVELGTAFRDMDESMRTALVWMWKNHNEPLTDMQILHKIGPPSSSNPQQAIHAESDPVADIMNHVRPRFPQRVHSSSSLRSDSQLIHEVSSRLLPEIAPLDFASYLLLQPGLRESGTAAIEKYALMIARYSGDAPVRDALNDMYGLLATDTAEAIAAATLAVTGALTAAQALDLVRAAGLSGASFSKLGLLANALAVKGTDDPQMVIELSKLYDADPLGTVKKYGTINMYMTHCNPSWLPPANRGDDADLDNHALLLSHLGLNGAAQCDEHSLAVLQALESEDIAKVYALAGLNDTSVSIQYALCGVSTFGPRITEWLQLVAHSPAIQDAKLFTQLDSKQENDISRLSAAVHPKGEQDVLSAVHLSGFYRGLSVLAGSGDPVAAMAALSDEDLRKVIPNQTSASKQAGDLTNGLCEETRVWLRNYASVVKQLGSGSKESAKLEAALTDLMAELRGNTTLLTALVPSGTPAQLAKRAAEHASIVADAGEEMWDLAVENEAILWGSSLLQEDRATGAIGPENAQARRADAVERLDLWKQYATASVSGDIERQRAVGLLLAKPSMGPLSVHDALQWLPRNLDAATAPDGTLFGNWLLENRRGFNALQNSSGTVALTAAALSWSLLGGKNAELGELVRRSVSLSYGGHDDPTSTFYAKAKVSRNSATRSAVHMHYSKDLPTLFPVGKVFEASSAASATDSQQPDSSGYRGYFLSRSDPRGTQLGMLVPCCQHPDGAGSACSMAGQSNPASGFFVVEDSQGVPVAQSWVWAASATVEGSVSTGVIFDSIEGMLSDSPSRAAAIRKVYDQAADELVKSGFDRVLVGNANSMLGTADLPTTETPLSAAAIGYYGYLGDSHTQRVWRERSAGATDNKITVTPNGFTVSEGESSFTFRAANVLAERADIEKKLGADLLDDAQRAPLLHRLSILNGLFVHPSSNGWAAGLFVEPSALTDDEQKSGPHRNIVQFRGPNGRELAMTALGQGDPLKVVFVDELGNPDVDKDGNDVETAIKGSPTLSSVSEWRTDYASLPVDYTSSSPALTEILVSLNIPKEDATTYLEAFNGNMDASLKAYRNGWPASLAKDIAHGARLTALTEHTWLGNSPCPSQILQESDAYTRSALVYRLAAVTELGDPSSLHVLTIKDAAARVELMAAIRNVAQQYTKTNGSQHGTQRSRHVTWPLAVQQARVTREEHTAANDVRGTRPDITDAQVAEAGRLLGLAGPSPYAQELLRLTSQRDGGLLDESQREESEKLIPQLEKMDSECTTMVQDTLRLALDKIAENRELGVPTAWPTWNAADREEAAAANSPVWSARGRYPVELLITGGLIDVANNPALADDLYAKGFSPSVIGVLCANTVSSTVPSSSPGYIPIPGGTSQPLLEYASSEDSPLDNMDKLKILFHVSSRGQMHDHDVVKLMKTDFNETAACETLDRNNPGRALDFRTAIHTDTALPGESREDFRQRTQVPPEYSEETVTANGVLSNQVDYETQRTRIDDQLNTYRKATKHVNIPSTIPAADVYRMGKAIDSIRGLAQAAGVTPNAGEHMPDYYFDAHDVEVLSAVAVSPAELSSAFSGVYATIKDLLTVAPILRELVDRLPVEISRTVSDAAIGVRSGCTAAEIVAIDALDIDNNTKRSLLHSPTLRKAYKDNIRMDVLETVGKYVKADHSNYGHDAMAASEDTNVRWLLDVVTQNPEALEHLRELGDRSILRVMRELVANFGGLPESLGNVVPDHRI